MNIKLGLIAITTVSLIYVTVKIQKQIEKFQNKFFGPYG